MCKIVAIAILAMILMAGVSADDYCFKFYRVASMELWQIKSGSVLCKIDTFDSSYSDTIKLKANNNTLNFRFRNKVSSIEDNWKNSCPDLGKRGVALYEPHSSGGIIVAFNEDNTKTPGSFVDSQNDGLGAYKRTTYYIKEGDIKIIGEGNALINSILVGIFIFIFCIVCSIKFHFTAGALFLATLIFSLSISQGAFKFYNTAILIINVSACCIFSTLVGGLLWFKLSRKHAAITAIALTALVIAYSFFAGYVFHLFVVVLMFTLSAVFSIKTSEEVWMTNMGLACMVSNLRTAFNMLVMRTPTTAYMDISTGTGHYPNCTNISIFGEVLLYSGFTFILLVSQIVLLCLSRKRVEQKPADVDAALAGDAYI